VCIAALGEHPIALDYAQRALEHFRQSGEWRGLAEAYFGIALAQVQEGDYEGALENLQQALKLVGDHSASYTLGRIYSNMAGVLLFLKRPQEGIRYLEKESLITSARTTKPPPQMVTTILAST